MKSITINCPETVLTSIGLSKDGLTKDLALTAAVKYFEDGKLSSGTAAELAGLSRLEFIEKLRDYEISMIDDDFDELIEDYHHA